MTDDADFMCPNCVTPWCCNGPHLNDQTPYARDGRAAADDLMAERQRADAELGRAFREAQEALPKGWWLRTTTDPQGMHALAFNTKSAAAQVADGYSASPVEALDALTARLRETGR